MLERTIVTVLVVVFGVLSSGVAFLSRSIGGSLPQVRSNRHVRLTFLCGGESDFRDIKATASIHVENIT